MVVRVTERERATVLAALRRWLSYPAAREADSIATSGGKYKPLDNSEIERLCKRMTEIGRKNRAAWVRQSGNGARQCADNQHTKAALTTEVAARHVDRDN